jgi:predicted RNA-binding protein with PIN domain
MAPERSRILIIDGHNVIFRFEELKRLGEGAPERLSELLNAGSLTDFDRIIVFFDASEDEERRVIVGRVEAHYTQRGTKADTRVVQAAREMIASGADVYVVSADWAIQIGAIGQGGYRMTPQELMERVKAPRRDRRPPRRERDTLYDRLSSEDRKKIDELYESLVRRGQGRQKRPSDDG